MLVRKYSVNWTSEKSLQGWHLEPQANGTLLMLNNGRKAGINHLHEDYLSVLRMTIEGWQKDILQIPTWDYASPIPN